jgi:diguanylate cyclase (GGDEF)-like protein
MLLIVQPQTTPHHIMDVQNLRLDAALSLIEQSGRSLDTLPDPAHAEPSQYVQSILDALCTLSSHDALTGLANRRHFAHAMEQELDRVARSGDVALLLMVDIDHFKMVNDQHGHLAGDAVLKQVAQRILGCVRPMDSVSRFGGEEFSIVLPNCSYSYGPVVAERIRKAMESAPFVLPIGQNLFITVSLGGAYAPQWIRSEAAIWIERADRQLYRAKKEGRNRVCMEDTIDTVVSTEEKELLYGALHFDTTGPYTPNTDTQDNWTDQ